MQERKVWYDLIEILKIIIVIIVDIFLYFSSNWEFIVKTD